MDFFEAQDQARRNTWKLVVLYLIAVVLIITAVYLVTLALFGYAAETPPGAAFSEQIWHPGLLLSVSTVMVVIILIGTLFRVAQLKKGGSAVAEMLGGRKIEPSTRDRDERRLINVIEEMSIASGLPVPDVYVLDREENINAFAAGFGTNDAAVGVTRGTLKQLNRDELQGVIAHEFSHIFNGDMRLNIRLIGILNGILLIHIMGMLLMRSSMFAGMRRGGGRGGQGGGGAAIAIILLGVSLLIIGYIGMVFGRMIQAAISRQREYLADAAAVQYTRNPEGLAGALRKIAGKKKGSEIKDGHAMEMSHLFFANSFYSAIGRAFATHPPIEKRIRAIDPAHDPEHQKMKQRLQKRLEKDRIARAESAAAQPGPAAAPGGHAALKPEVILAAIGTLDGAQVEQAGRLLSGIPARLRQAAHEPLDAEALIYALLLSGRKVAAETTPDWLTESIGEQTAAHAAKLLAMLKKGRREWYLPLAELALPTLRQMSREQYNKFRETVERLVKEDKSLNLFEFALEKMIVRQLDTAFSKKKEPEIRHRNLKTLGRELTVLLSAIAHASDKDAKAAWQAGLKQVEALIPEGMKLLPLEECRLEELDGALTEVVSSSNPVKKYVLAAVVHCVAFDQRISVDEQELLRAISEAIDCPIPLGSAT